MKPLLFALFAAAFFAIGADPRVSANFYRLVDVPDPGAQILFSGWSHLRSALNLDPGNSSGDLLAFQAAVVLLLSALLLVPQLPTLITVGGQIALLSVWWVFGDISSTWHAVEAWTVVVVAVYLAALALGGGRRMTWVVSPLFGAVLGYVPLMRQSAGILVLLPIGCIAGGALLARFAGSRAMLRGVGVPLLVFATAFVGVRLLAPRLWIAIQHTPFREHYAGFPLLLSLGFANNAYNIVWDDDFAMSQGVLHEGVPWFDNPTAQGKLMDLWRARILEDPALLARTVAAKLFYLLRYFSGTLDPMATSADGYPLRPSVLTLVLGLGFSAAGAYMVSAFARAPSERMLVILAGITGLAVAVVAPLVLIAPFYLGGAIALCVATLVIALPAVHIARGTPEPREPRARRTMRAYRVAGIVALAVLLLGAGFVLHRSIANRADARALLAEDPIRQLEALDEHDSFRFNRLPLAEQRRLIQRWAAADPARVFRAVPTSRTESALFRPVIAMRHNRLVFVVAWLSDLWTLRLPSRVQGPRNSVLHVAQDADRGPGLLHYLEAPSNYLKIADADWDNRYRMFCLPAAAGVSDDARYFSVSAYYFTGGDHGSGLALELIAGDRLIRGDLLRR